MMIRIVLLWFLIGLTLLNVNAQTDQVGSGRALRFDGVNDHINLGNIYDNITLPVTISAWVKVDPSASYGGIFASQDNLPLYNGFQFTVSPTTISIEYGDGLGENDPVFRRGKNSSISNIANRWVHVAAVMRSALDMDLYINGVNIGGNYVGSSPNSMSSNFPADEAKIGTWNSNGQSFPYRGEIDELRIWNRTLSQTDIRQLMCKKLVGNESGLIGYWNFDELSGNTVYDKSSNGFNGQLVNGPARVFSGAPIGDESVVMYSGSWAATTVSITEGLHTLNATNIQGNPNGVHLYVVRNAPSQTIGLSNPVGPYFGVFLAALDYGNSFDLTLNEDACGNFSREDNSITSWTNLNAPITNKQDRIEIIQELSTAELNIDLGADEVVCPLIPRTLRPLDNPLGYQFTWQDGSSQSTYQVTEYGTYWVTVQNACQVDQDTITFTKAAIALSFDLGDDQVACPIESIELTPLSNPTGYEFTWQNGSKQSSFEVKEYGTYWVTVENECSIATDTIRIVKPEYTSIFMPNVFTPNSDNLNPTFVVDDQFVEPRLLVFNRWGRRVFESTNYKNNWDGGELASGTYYYYLIDQCAGTIKGIITILR